MKRILLIVAILLTIGQVSAQKNKNKTTYAGIVLSGDDNKPLPGVSVIVSNTVIGTQTDVDGRFRFQGPAHAELSISYLGFETQQIRPQHPLNIKVVLMPDDKLIDEVVVVGYGTARKSELTTASSGLRSRDMVTEGVTSFEQSLQGKLSGVVVTNTEGAPGSSMSMEIRGVASISGTSEPLYVIDGIPMDSDEDLNASQTGRSFTQGLNPMAMLNAQDIESIEILKDASATSIYGSRGANGVVLITTKSGREGRATVNASYSMGFSSLVRMIDVLSPIEYAEYRNWAQGSDRYTPEVMATLSNNPHRWQDLIYRTGRTQDYALSVSGGTKKFTYMLSGNYFDQQGIIINSGFSRATFRSNLAFELRPGVRLLSRTNFSRGVYDQVASSTSGADSKQQGIIKQALRMDPAMPKDKDYDPELDGLIDTDGTLRNPYIEATEPTLKTATNRITSGLTLEAQLTKHLLFRPTFSVDYAVSRADTYYPATTQQGKSTAGNDMGFASLQYVESMKWANENQLTYQNTFAGKHAFTATAVMSLEQLIRARDRSSARGFVSDDLLNNVLQNGLSETYVLQTGKTKTSLMSYTGRINYGYDRRYMFTAAVRADGSSKFGKNNRWGVFPSVSAAWNAMNEKWFSNTLSAARINNLRLRFSWGLVGNQAIPAYQSQSTVSLGWYPSSGEDVPTAVAVRLANPDLKWESTEQYNVGFDFGAFDNRLTLTVNWYRKDTKDLLQNILIPASTGFQSQYQNRGAIRNQGMEFELTARPVETKNFTWNIMANISFNRNEITDLGDVTEQFTADLGSLGYTPFIQKVGYSLGTLWGYKADGVYQNLEECADIKSSVIHGLNEGDSDELRYQKMVGEVRYVDTNHDGVIDDSDRVKIGDVNPAYTFGITNVFTWKRLSLNVLIVGRMGGDVYNQVFSELESLSGYSNMTREAFYGRWQGEGTSYTYPKLHNINNPRKRYVSSFFVEDASFVRIKNVRLSFAFDKKLTGLKWFPDGAIWFAVDNLATFTDYRGYDPEVSSYGQSAAYRGIDMGAYPQCRTYSVGINFKF